MIPRISAKALSALFVAVSLTLAGPAGAFGASSPAGACGSVFGDEKPADVILTWDMQKQLRKDFEELRRPDDLSYSYSTPKDLEAYRRQLAEIETSGKNRKTILDILSAFEKGVLLPTGTILFRGIGPGVELRGKSLRWNRLTSTTMDPETARYFTNKGNDRTSLLVIEVASPLKALMSQNPKETEFILPPGTRFDVLSRSHDRDSRISVLRVRASP